MRMTIKVALTALALAGGAAAIATPAAAQGFGLGFGPGGGITFSYDSGGYCDQWGCPDDFWDMPVYYGAVFAGGQWYDGPVYYRDGRLGREYWIHGAWRRDEWRGPHPGWWRPGRYGPALGMDYYRQHNFHGRWDNGPGRPGPNFGPRGDDRGNFGPRDRFNGPQGGPPNNGPNNQPGPQGRPQPAPPAGNAAPGNPWRGFDPRQRFQQRGAQPNGAPQAPAQAAPAPAAPAPAGAPGGGGDRGDRRGPPQQ
jgi:hypothetical protein